jgi:hypothetical protein
MSQESETSNRRSRSLDDKLSQSSIERGTTVFFSAHDEQAAMEIVKRLPSYESAFFVSSGCCIVIFATVADAVNSHGRRFALDGECRVLRLLQLMGEQAVRLPSCSKTEKRRGEISEVKVFVGNLKSTTRSQTLRSYFQRFGAVADCGVVRKPDGSSAGFGYCSFENAASVQICLARAKHVLEGFTIAVRPYKCRF